MSPKGPPSPLFGCLRLIFENFLMSPKGPPFIFWYFAKERTLKNSRRSLLSDFSALWDFRIFFAFFSNSHFFRNFFEVSKWSPFNFFWNIAKEWMLKNLKEPPFTVFGLVRLFKSNTFCLKIRFSQAQHAISDFFFQRPVFFKCDFFNFFHRSLPPPSIFTKNETFCDCKGLVKVFDTMRLQKICRWPSENFFEHIFCFFFKVFRWGR